MAFVGGAAWVQCFAVLPGAFVVVLVAVAGLMEECISSVWTAHPIALPLGKSLPSLIILANLFC